MAKDRNVGRSAYSPREIAERWGCGHDKVYREIRAGRIKVKKLGGRSLITVDEEERYLASLPELELGSSN